MSTEALVAQRLPHIVAFRHRLHQIPELCFEEHKTAAAIRAELDALENPAHARRRESAPTATVAVIGDPTKPCVALRADIDALPIAEQSGVPYASTHAGRMHACGHDGHIATLVGVAGVLKAREAELPVCVKLIWQPAQEGPAAGRRRLRKPACWMDASGPRCRQSSGCTAGPVCRSASSRRSPDRCLPPPIISPPSSSARERTRLIRIHKAPIRSSAAPPRR